MRRKESLAKVKNKSAFDRPLSQWTKKRKALPETTRTMQRTIEDYRK
jgi:hypothetical protein